MNIPQQLLRLFTSVIFLGFFSGSAIAGSAVALECPCNLIRINPTAVELDFNLVFTQNLNQSGPLEVYLRGHDNRDASRGSFYILAEASLASISFSQSPVPFTIKLPFYFTGFDSGYLSLVLVDANSGEILDMVSLSAQPVSVTSTLGAAVRIGYGELFFAQQPSFQVSGSSYEFDAVNITNSSNPLGSDNLVFEITASNLNTYYVLDEQSFTLNYDAQGRANINIQAVANSLLDGPLSYAPEHKYLQIAVYRGSQLLLFYTVAMLDNSALPDFSLDLSAVDTLTDSDGDTVSNYAELLRGSPADTPESEANANIETAFLFGDAALDYYGSVTDIEAQLSHLLSVANDAYTDSELNISLQKTALIYIGDDRAVTNNELLDRLAGRLWPFNNVDSLLARQADIIVHLSILSFDDINGGVAWINGHWNDGVIDFEGMASSGTNTAVVDMDNTALTLVHEVGHLLGLDHSRPQVQGAHYSSFPWALGRGENSQFVTIMGYSEFYNFAPQVALFSSPQLTCTDSGSSCGLSRDNYINGADAVSALKSSAYQWTAVANGFAPALTLVGDSPLLLDPSQSVINLGATAVDAEDGDITSAISFTQTEDNQDPAVDFLQTYSIVDSNNNRFSVIRKVALVIDTDSDGIYNRFDSDDDNDGVADNSDQFPLNSLYSADSDTDGMPDLWETFYGLDLNNSTDASSDLDVDGLTAVEEFTAGSVPIGSLDIDGNGQYDGLTDGLLILRYMFGFSGEQLINGSLAADALYSSASIIKARIEGLGDRIDIDGDNQLDALTDGLLILRYLLDFKEAALIDGALSEEALRVDPAAIEAYLQALKIDL
tara:strand:+ start:645 stop:3140 length:2496 start_codon:yes stop_codon:yes gene_type:complete